MRVASLARSALTLCAWGLVVALAALLTWAPIYAAQVRPSFTSYLTLAAGDNRPGVEPRTDFECSDTIYAVVEVTAPVRQEPTEHLLIVNWFNPDGKLQERTRHEFTSYGKGLRTWAWLRLGGGRGSSLGRMFDPSFGMSEFIGTWRAEIIIDDEELATHRFEVLC